jgi:hypothetical protein
MPELNITVDRIAYPPATADADAWYILITSHGAAKGRMPWRPQEGETLTLDGEWATYKGEREFAFKSARLNIPTHPRDQLRYVVSRTPGMGAAMEELIWTYAGEGWKEIREGAVPRLAGKVYAEFRQQIEALATKAKEVAVIATLMGKGATANMAAAAWAKWKDQTLGVVNADCYRLAELENYGFRDVDKEIRRQYGIIDSDPRRIRSAVIYSLRRLTDAGDTIVEWDELYRQTVGVLGGFAELVTGVTRDLFAEGVLKAFPDSGGVALAKDWECENLIWEWVENT